MNQYKEDFFNKLNISFKKGGTILDLGCGDGLDASIFINKFKLKVSGMDTYKHSNIDSISGLNFKLGTIYKLPYKPETFDYVFIHDVLHHIDEPLQRQSKHLEALNEVRRVSKKGGLIIIAEGNRFNPLFYPHMVLIRNHQHFRQSYFKLLIGKAFPKFKFVSFEAHLYPQKYIHFFKLYEKVMETLVPEAFRAYNVALITAL